MADLNIGFLDMASNLGASFEMIVCLLLFIGGLIFYAKDVRIGTVMHFLAFVFVFIWFYLMNLNWSIPLLFAIIFLCILPITIVIVAKTTERGAIV